MKAIVYVLALSLISIGSTVFAADRTAAAEPRASYTICNWGLLTIEESTERPATFIEIASPAEYSAVSGTTFVVAGSGAGLVEDTVIVEVSLPGGTVLFEDTTRLEDGEWSVEVELGSVEQSTKVYVRAYSRPDGNRRSGFDSLRLNANGRFGLRYVEITRPQYRAGVDSSAMVIAGTAGGAFENNVVIEVRDFASGEVLATTPATVAADEVGGSGPFSAEVAFDAAPGTGIEVRAYQPPVADNDSIEFFDVAFAVVNPLGETYDRAASGQRCPGSLDSVDAPTRERSHRCGRLVVRRAFLTALGCRTRAGQRS